MSCKHERLEPVDGPEDMGRCIDCGSILKGSEVMFRAYLPPTPTIEHLRERLDSVERLNAVLRLENEELRGSTQTADKYLRALRYLWAGDNETESTFADWLGALLLVTR